MRLESLVFGTAMALFTLPALAAAALPSGATSLNEVHGDWTVSCAVQGGSTPKLGCAVAQRQVNNGTGRSLLTIELTPAADGARGAMALPLGMDLAKGAVLQVDAGKSTPPQPYSTCVTAGCIIPLSFDAANLKLLRGGKTLNVLAVPINAKPVKLTVSLNGLPSALDRVSALLNSK